MTSNWSNCIASWITMLISFIFPFYSALFFLFKICRLQSLFVVSSWYLLSNLFLFPFPPRHRPRLRLRTVPLICLVRCFLFRILFSLSLCASLFILFLSVCLSVYLFPSLSSIYLFISSYSTPPPCTMFVFISP